MEENETTKLTRMPATNSGFALWGLVLRMNISAKNPPQRKAAKR
jgi:hypothetical protein